MAKKKRRVPRPPRQEFERKFLAIVPELPQPLPEPVHLLQGYLHEGEPYDRIRIRDGREAVLEYKASGNYESNKMPMDLADALYLLRCHRVGACVEKLRREIPAPYKGLIFELDECLGANRGLWIIELEHPSDFRLDRGRLPSFVGKDVTGDPRFKMRNLAKRPFKKWPRAEREKVLAQMGL